MMDAEASFGGAHADGRLLIFMAAVRVGDGEGGERHAEKPALRRHGDRICTLCKPLNENDLQAYGLLGGKISGKTLAHGKGFL